MIFLKQNTKIGSFFGSIPTWITDNENEKNENFLKSDLKNNYSAQSVSAN